MSNKKMVLLVALVLSLVISGCQEGLKSIRFDSTKAVQESAAVESNQGPSEGEGKSCPTPDPHPIAGNIAEKYQRDYQEIIDWYCQGYEFEDILLALQTHRLTDKEVSVTLNMTGNMSWKEIWDQYDLNP